MTHLMKALGLLAMIATTASAVDYSTSTDITTEVNTGNGKVMIYTTGASDVVVQVINDGATKAGAITNTTGVSQIGYSTPNGTGTCSLIIDGGSVPHPTATAVADPIEQLLDGRLRREFGQFSGEVLLERLSLAQRVPLQCRRSLHRRRFFHRDGSRHKMKKLYREFLDSIDGERLMAHTARVWACEFGQTFRDYAKAAQEVVGLMNAEGIPNVAAAEFPADGRTTCFDATMPLAWDASLGRLTLLDPDARKEERIADYARHPFHLVKGSVSTPAGGIVTRLVTEPAFRNGADVRGAMVLFDAETAATRNSIAPLLDKGALGFMTDHISARARSMDALPWLNAATDSGSWHVNSRDRPFIGFTVTPRTRVFLAVKLPEPMKPPVTDACVYAYMYAFDSAWISTLPVANSLEAPTSVVVALLT